MTKLGDAALYELWLTAKDGDAFAELARRHAPVVHDIAARTLRDRTAAEDVVQEALLDLALERTRKPAEVGVAAWLVRFAICRARNWRSSEQCRTRRQWIVGARRPEETMPDDAAELTEETERALAAAEPDERVVLAMRFLHGWDYDQIAAALETSEGAARVRVHRALANVRARLGTGDEEPRVASRLAGLALIPLPAARLDDAIRSAIEAASAPAPVAPASRIPDALRAAIFAFSVAVMLAGASEPSLNLASLPGTEHGADASASAVAPASGATESAARTGGPADRCRNGIPRPADWDRGALARLARGEPDLVPEAPRPVPAAPTASAPASPKVAESPRADPAPTLPEPPSALRPSVRGASAANSDPGSSDDERADALAGSVRTAASEIVIERSANEPVVATNAAEQADAATVSDPAPPRRRAALRVHDTNDLGHEAQALLSEAAALVRTAALDAVAAAPGGGDAALQAAKRHGVRNVKRQVRDLNTPANGPPVPAGKKAAKLSRIYAILFDLALHDRAATDAVRWPDGVDMADALADLIRVLTAPPRTDPSRMPDLADDGSSPAPEPSRLPEFE